MGAQAARPGLNPPGVAVFTGIVQALGRVRAVHAEAQDCDFVVECPAEIASKLELGASIAIDGVCQTVTALESDSFTVHAIAETLRVTTLGRLGSGASVNLEPALGAGDPLGGHFVQGHVDGTATLRAKSSLGESIEYALEGPEDLVKQLVPKGSVTLDGVSLTVGPDLTDSRFSVYLIPHTLEVTTLGDRNVGDSVNLETDILGKYILRYLSGRDAAGGLTFDDLRRAGYGSGS
jgi:riboflavin synthase alpha subunit